jgi:site-specific recombinase XerD
MLEPRADRHPQPRAARPSLPRGVPHQRSVALVPKGSGPHGWDCDRASRQSGKRRTIGLDPGAFAVVERWLDVRTKLGISSRAPIICTLKGKPVASAYVRALMPRLARRAGIEKRVHAHGLRHTHAAELALEGHPMNLIQMQLGHSSLSTTSRYLAHIAPTHLIAAMRARTWSL